MHEPEEYGMRVGFIGLGTMGAHAARNILRRDFPLVVHDIRAEAARPLIEMGTELGTDPVDVLARVDVVVTMVFGPKEIEQVAREENGLFSAPCGGKTWIDLTTSSPSLMRALGREFAERGGYPIDAPVTGAVDGAIRGDMLMFVGGDDAAVERVRAVIEAMGESRQVGKHGNAYVAKLVNNMLWKVHAAAIGEAMVAAKVAGLEPEVWWEAMKGGAADSYVMHHDVPAVFAGHYDPSSTIDRKAFCRYWIASLDEQTLRGVQAWLRGARECARCSSRPEARRRARRPTLTRSCGYARTTRAGLKATARRACARTSQAWNSRTCGSPARTCAARSS